MFGLSCKFGGSAQAGARPTSKTSSGATCAPNRRGAPHRRRHGQPRRSHSQAQHTSPCQRWCSRRYGEVGGTGSSPLPEEVADQQGEHGVDVLGRYVAQQRPRRRSPTRRRGRRRAGRSARTASRARRRRRPASSSRRSRPGRRSPIRKLSSRMSVWTSVSPAVTSAKPAASAAASSRWGRSGWVARTWSQNADQLAELVLERVQRQPVGRRREVGRHRLERVEAGVEVVRSPGPLRVAAVDVLEAEHDPVVVEGPQQPGRGDAVGQGRELAGLLAVGVGEQPLRLDRRGLHEVPRPVLAVRTDAKPGVNPAPCDSPRPRATRTCARCRRAGSAAGTATPAGARSSRTGRGTSSCAASCPR